MDLELETFICRRCKRKRQVPKGKGKIICVHCDRQMADKHKRTVIRKYRNLKKNAHQLCTEFVTLPITRKPAHIHPEDKALLEKLHFSISGEAAFRHVYNRQKGLCSRCRKPNKQLRINLYKYKRAIHTLICYECLHKAPVKHKKVQEKIVEQPWQFFIWKKADPVLKTLLMANPTFTVDLPLPEKDLTSTPEPVILPIANASNSKES